MLLVESTMESLRLRSGREVLRGRCGVESDADLFLVRGSCCVPLLPTPLDEEALDRTDEAEPVKLVLDLAHPGRARSSLLPSELQRLEALVTLAREEGGASVLVGVVGASWCMLHGLFFLRRLWYFKLCA